MAFANRSTLKSIIGLLKRRGYNVTISEATFATKMGAFFKPLKYLTAGIGAAYFYLFILEEAVQTAGFGIGIVMQKKMWKEAAVQNRRYRDVAEIGLKATKIISLNYLKEEMDASDEQMDQLLRGLSPFIGGFNVDQFNVALGMMEMVFMPFSEFFSIAVETSEMYDAAIAGETQQVGSEYKNQLDMLKKSFADDKFRLKLAHDERIDKIAVEKRQRLDELAIEVKAELQKLAAGLRKKEIQRDEADRAKILIAQEKDKIEISIKQEFDERDRIEKEVHENAVNTIEKAEDKRLAELRQKFFISKLSRMEVEALIGKDTTKFSGVVERVIDADTIVVKGFYIRLLGINAPEADTEEGQDAKAYLKTLIEGQTVTLETDPADKFDHFDRMLATVTLGTTNISLHLLETCRAFLFTLSKNSLVDKKVYNDAALVCLTGGTPAPAPIPEPLPPAPEPEPKKEFIAAVKVVDESNNPVAGIYTEFRTPAGIFFPRTDSAGIAFVQALDGDTITIIINDNIDYAVLPELKTQVTFIYKIFSDRTDTIIIRNLKTFTQPLPADVNNISGVSVTARMGLLEPRSALHDAVPASLGQFIDKREFTLEEISGEFESVAMRLQFNGPFTNNQTIQAKFVTTNPDGSMTAGFPVNNEIPTPQSQGFEWWNWYAFGLAMAGPPREINQKGIYATDLIIISGDAIAGSYTWFWRVI